MTALPLALSISSTFTKIGAIAAFAALVGIAILSLLVFSQARELKRLREWAGRAPERAADLEQRVSNNAAARLQQQVPGGETVRSVPRAAPIQAQAAAAGAGPATRVVGGPGVAVVPAGQPLSASGAPVAPAPGTPGVPLAQPPAPGAPPQAPPPGRPVVPAALQPSVPGQSPGVARPAVPGHAPMPGQPSAAPPQAPVPAQPTASAQPASSSVPLPGPAVGVPASVAGAARDRPPPGATAGTPAVGDPRPPAPATAAAAAAAVPRAPSPPRAPLPAGAGQAIPQSPPAHGQPVQPAARRPPAPAPAGATPRSDTRAPILSEGRRATYTTGRSTRRTAALIVGGLVVLAAVVVGLATALGGSSGHKATTSNAATTATHTATKKPARSHKTASKPAAKASALGPAETNVAVLNATETEGLAHRTANELQQNGYSQAAALNGKPPGSGQVSIVEYSSGHQAEAESVAHSANVTHVQPMEAAVAALANSAPVVLIVGADKATQSP